MKSFNRLLGLILLTLAVLSCRVDDNGPIQPHLSQNNMLSGDDIPDIINHLNQKFNLRTGPQAGANEDVGFSIGNIDLEQIFEVIDTLGNANYTFSVDDEDNNPYNFTNLIVKKRESGLIDEPYLLEYTPDSAFVDEFISSGFAMDQFTGKIRKRYLSDVSVRSGNNANLTGGSNSYLDNAPCDKENNYSNGIIVVGNGGGGGGEGNTDQGGDLDTSGDPDYVCTQRWEQVTVRTRWKDGACCDSHVVYKLVTVCHFVNPSNGANDDDGCPDPESEEIGVLPALDIFLRIDALDKALATNPAKLLDIPCQELEKWKSVGEFRPQSTIVNKIDELDKTRSLFADLFTGSYKILDIEEAKGTNVNMDYFGVTVTELPQGMTPQELLKRIRTGLNGFVNTRLSDFSPFGAVQTGYNEAAIWESNNPVGAVLHIGIPGNDGAVICSDAGLDYWRFTTIRAPYDWDHPVSGTREFGYEQNPDGSYVFYTRGVDRITQKMQDISLASGGLLDGVVNKLIEGIAFSQADLLWESLQQGISDFVNNSGGFAYKNNPIKYRPKWDDVAAYIRGDLPLSELGCD